MDCPEAFAECLRGVCGVKRGAAAKSAGCVCGVLRVKSGVFSKWGCSMSPVHGIKHQINQANRAQNLIRHGRDIMNKMVDTSKGALGGILWWWYLGILLNK